MGLTHFPHGVSSFGVPIIGSGPILTTGKIFFVDANSADGRDTIGHGEDPEHAFLTLDFAIGQCRAGKGDHIIVMPDHAETITGVAGLAFDVAGITVIGLGSYNQRPRFLMDEGTTVTGVLSAADVTLRNLVFAAGHADIVAGIVVTAEGAWLDQIEFVNNVVDENFLTPIKATSTTDNNADGLKVTNCAHYTVDASTLEFLELNADIFGLKAYDNIVISEGTAVPFILQATGKDLQFCHIAGNRTSNKQTAGNLFITNDTASPNNSGVIERNWCGHADVTSSHTFGAVGGCRFFENRSVSTDALSGFTLPAIDVDS